MTHLTSAPTLALLLACGGVSSPEWAMSWNGTAELAGWRTAIETIQEEAARVCPRGGEALASGLVQWHADPFPCGDLRAASGCDWGRGSYSVLWRGHVEDTALVDELGHEVWVACYGRSGEGPAHDYDPDFAAWLGIVRTEIGRRLGR